LFELCRQLSEDTFEICRTPFFVYDVALGDIVQTAREEQQGHLLYETGKTV